jgi:putative tryptophan/tyrosine transport system substrate-binding protein
VSLGLVASISRPEGNVTGVAFSTAGLGAKRVELLRELAPNAGTMALLVNPESQVPDVRQAESAARAIGQPIVVLEARNPREIDAAFGRLAEHHAGSLLVTQDPFFAFRRAQLAALAVGYAVPALYYEREFAVAGGLMSYGVRLRDLYHQAGLYVGRILKGAKPGDLPVVLATTIELVINLKAAAALGLAVPPTLLARADEVIE